MATANDFPLNPVDGALAELEKQNGSTVVYRYDAADGAWKVVGVNGGTTEYVTTVDVQTTIDEPARPVGYDGLDSTQDLGYLTNQKLVNWFFAEEILTNKEDLEKIIWISEDPPPEGELYIFWFDVDRLELLIKYNDQWFPVSIPPDQLELVATTLTELQRDTMLNKLANDQLRRDIIAGDFRPNLEQVLTQGNISDKNIVLTNAENDAILLSPEDGRLMVGGVGEDVVPSIELRHSQGALETSIVKLELDEEGKRFDIECDEKVDNIHFRFEEDEKFILNKKGDAVFTGKVQGEPGTQNNEFVTYGQLTTLEEEIEQLAPSLERGSWNFTLNHPPGPGEYTMISGFLSEDEQRALCTQEYTECYANNMDDPLGQQQCNRDLETCTDAVSGDLVVTTDQWTECDQLVFNAVDSKGVEHTWAGIDSDHYIDVFNEADEGFMVGDIATHGGGSFSFDLVSSKGVASGLASVKIFKTEGTVDFNQYVRKAGDSMTGMLSLDPSGGNALRITANDEADERSLLLYVYGQANEEGQRPVLFSVVADGRVSVSDKYTPTSKTHLTPKSYVDNAVLESPSSGAAQFRWYVDSNKSESFSPSERHAALIGGDKMENISMIRFHATAANGHKLSFPHSSEPIYTGTSGNGPFLTAWYYNKDTKQWTWRGSAKVAKLNVVNGYIEADLTSRKGPQTLNNGTTYYFTIGGFF